MLVAKQPALPEPTGDDRTAIVFRTKNEPGALVRVLQEFAARGVDMTRIESRPTREEPNTYDFFVDLAGHASDAAVAAALLSVLAAPVLAAPRSDFSDDRTAQRLWQDTRQTMQEQEQKVREYRLDIPAEHIGQTAETDPEADQGEALFNAVNRSDWQTVRPLLERYTQQTEYDPDIALFARASLARGGTVASVEMLLDLAEADVPAEPAMAA